MVSAGGREMKKRKSFLAATLLAAVPAIFTSLIFFSCKSKDQFDCDELVSSDYQSDVERIQSYLEENKFEGAVLVSRKKEAFPQR